MYYGDNVMIHPKYTIPFGSTFLVVTGRETIYHYNSSSETFEQMPTNMSDAVGYEDILIIVDMDIFPSCNEDET